MTIIRSIDLIGSLVITMYYIIVCDKCKRSKIVKSKVKFTICPYCGNHIKVSRNIVYICKSIEIARKFKAIIDSNVKLLT